MNKLRKNSKGVVLVTVVIVGMILTFLAMSLADVSIKQYRRTTDNLFDTNALLVAEAGIERSVYQLNTDNDFEGYTTEQQFFNNSVQGRGTYQTFVTGGENNEKFITSTGKVYSINGANSVVSSRKIRVSLVGTTSEGYSVYTGPGGLILGGSANISNSEIYVNGYITMSGSAQIGTNSKPLKINVANRRCPLGTNPGDTYPQVCGSGNQPISISSSAKMYGSVCATGQTSSNRIYPGVDGEGLISGCETSANVTQPAYDRAAHISRMSPLSGYDANSSTYSCGGSQTKTWPANLRLNGNVTIGASCKLTINGDIYITGDLTIQGSAQIRVKDGLATQPVIVVDGKVNSGGSGSLIANSDGIGFRVISFKSAAACGANCTNVTGTDLYNSQNLETIKVDGSASLAGMIFQAYWGKVTLTGSGNLGSVIGQTVELNGSGTVVFGLSLSSGVSTWTIRSYQQLYN